MNTPAKIPTHKVFGTKVVGLARGTARLVIENVNRNTLLFTLSQQKQLELFQQLKELLYPGAVQQVLKREKKMNETDIVQSKLNEANAEILKLANDASSLRTELAQVNCIVEDLEKSVDEVTAQLNICRNMRIAITDKQKMLLVQQCTDAYDTLLADYTDLKAEHAKLAESVRPASLELELESEPELESQFKLEQGTRVTSFEILSLGTLVAEDRESMFFTDISVDVLAHSNNKIEKHTVRFFDHDGIDRMEQCVAEGIPYAALVSMAARPKPTAKD